MPARPGADRAAGRGPQGRRPVAPHRIKREWRSGYGFVRPGTAETFWLLLPEVTTEWMSWALEEWARWADPEGRRRRVLRVDRASWHPGGALAVPPSVELFALPASPPELQPVESAGPLVREVVANQAFASLEPRTAQVSARCRWCIEHPEGIQAAASDDWAAVLNQ